MQPDLKHHFLSSRPNLITSANGVKFGKEALMYDSVCKFGGERGMEGKNGFHIWPRTDDREVGKGKA